MMNMIMMIDDDGIVPAFAVRVFRALQKDGNLTVWPFKKCLQQEDVNNIWSKASITFAGDG